MQEGSPQTTARSSVSPAGPSFGSGPKLYERRIAMNVKDKRQGRTIPEQEGRGTMMKTTVAKFGLLAGGLVFAGGLMFAGGTQEEDPPSIAQVVALDECDPGTFNAALGPDFCKNVALGAATKLDRKSTRLNSSH